MSGYYRLSRTLLSRELVHDAFKKAVTSMNPNEDGTCIVIGCSGLVKKKVAGITSGIPVYIDPRCDTCGKPYLKTSLVEVV